MLYWKFSWMVIRFNDSRIRRTMKTTKTIRKKRIAMRYRQNGIDDTINEACYGRNNLLDITHLFSHKHKRSNELFVDESSKLCNPKIIRRNVKLRQ